MNMQSKIKKEVMVSAPGAISGTVDARAFTARLRTLAKHADKYGSTPILNFVTLQFRDDAPVLSVSHFGIDMAMSATLTAEGRGGVSVPLKTLLAFMAGADGETVTMTKAESDNAVRFECGAWKIDLFPLPVSDVPTIALPDPVRAFAMAEGMFRHLFGFAAAFVSKEETRYYLNGVCLEVDANAVRTVATDDHRLGTRDAATPAPVEALDKRAIIPNDAVSALLDIIGPAQCFITLHARPKDGGDPSHITVTREGWTVVSKLIDGTFPDWRRIIPQALGDSIATVDASAFNRLAKIVKGTGERGRAVKVAPSDAGLSLSVTVPGEAELTGSASGEVSAPFNPFGVNLYYLDSIAKAFGTKKLKMAIQSPTDPFIISTPDSPKGEFAVLIPMRV